MLRASAAGVRARFDPAERRLAVADGDGLLLAGEPSLAVDGHALPADGADPETEGGQLRYGPAGGSPVATTVSLTAADGGIDLEVAVENAGAEPVTLERATLLAATELPPFGPGARVFEHGYQSWTPSGGLPVGERFPEEPAGQRPMMVDPAAPDDRRTSHYLTALSSGDRGLVAGFLAHERFLSRFELEDDGDGVHQLAAVVPGEGVTVAPGERLVLPPLRFAAGDVGEGLRAVADGVADRMDPRVPERAPTGWCSWYDYGREVTPAAVRENLAAVDDRGLPLATVQLDDGYQTAFGDWRSLASGFEDVAGLVDDVAAAGHRPGLWLAPFLAEGDADVVQSNPEWVLTDDGEPVDAGQRHGQMVALDPTHPGVEQWLRDTVGTVVDDWGFDYLKLDFLYAAALPGDHHDGSATRVEAYRRGLRAVRAAAGEGTFLLGCGAPLAPTVGLVDAMRVGPDVGPEWVDSLAGSQPGLRNAVRNSLHRQFAHRRWWVNDPDCQLLRPSTGLSPAERRSFAAVVALSGGANVVGDRLAALDDDGLALLRSTLPPVADGSVPEEGVERLPPRLVCRRPDGGAAVAVFNWTDEPRTLTASPADVGAAGVRGWLPGPGEPFEGRVARERPPHGCLLAHVAPARERPHVVGARDHLAGGGSLLARADWTADGGDGRLLLATDGPSLELLVAAPGGWTAASDHARAGDYLVVPVDDEATRLRFSR